MFTHLKTLFKHLKKAMNKEVREGEKHLEIDAPKVREIKDLRKRQKQVETSRLKSLEETMKSKKAKRAHPHRMRSTPGEVVGRDSMPSSPHKEGKRWISNSRKKTKTQNKVLNKIGTKRS